MNYFQPLLIPPEILLSTHFSNTPYIFFFRTRDKFETAYETRGRLMGMGFCEIGNEPSGSINGDYTHRRENLKSYLVSNCH
jgi:hypothetical protein